MSCVINFGWVGYVVLVIKCLLVKYLLIGFGFNYCLLDNIMWFFMVGYVVYFLFCIVLVIYLILVGI